MNLQAKRIGIVHGLMHTSRRWEHLAGCFDNAESIQLQMRDCIAEIARELAGRLAGYDILIAHSMGGLVVHQAIKRYGAPKPQTLFYVSTPFWGISVPGYLAPLLKIPKSRRLIRGFSKLTVTHPQFVDDIMIDDVLSQDFVTAARLFAEMARYREAPVALPGIETFNVVAAKDHVCRPPYMYRAHNVLFRESGHTIPLEFEEQFVRMVKRVCATT